MDPSEYDEIQWDACDIPPDYDETEDWDDEDVDEDIPSSAQSSEHGLRALARSSVRAV